MPVYSYTARIHPCCWGCDVTDLGCESEVLRMSGKRKDIEMVPNVKRSEFNGRSERLCVIVIKEVCAQ